MSDKFTKPAPIWPGGTVCRVSRAWLDNTRFYCDTCGKVFTDRAKPPCEHPTDQETVTDGKETKDV